MTSTATWFRSAAIVSQDEAVAFFASRLVNKSALPEITPSAPRRTASLSGSLIKR